MSVSHAALPSPRLSSAMPAACAQAMKSSPLRPPSSAPPRWTSTRFHAVPSGSCGIGAAECRRPIATLRCDGWKASTCCPAGEFGARRNGVHADASTSERAVLATDLDRLRRAHGHSRRARSGHLRGDRTRRGRTDLASAPAPAAAGPQGGPPGFPGDYGLVRTERDADPPLRCDLRPRRSNGLHGDRSAGGPADRPARRLFDQRDDRGRRA